MAVEAQVLGRIAALGEVRDKVREAVLAIGAAQRSGGDDSMTKQRAVSILDGVVEDWLTQSGLVEDELRELALTDTEQPVDNDGAGISTRADAVERLWAISLLHLAIAADLAALSAVDALNENEPVSVSPWVANYPSAITAITDEARIGELLPVSAREADDADHGIAFRFGVAGIDVLDKLVNRATECTCAILVGVAPTPPADLVIGAVTPLLNSAFGALSGSIATAAARIVRTVTGWVLRLLQRVREVMDALKADAFDFVRDEVFKHLGGIAAEYALFAFVRPAVATVLRETSATKQLRQKRSNRLSRRGAPPDTAAALSTIFKHNHRWITRPVPKAAETVLRPLWHVAWSGVPAAPIAACLLLAWALLLTGDELDIPHWPFPDFYRPGLLSLPH